MASSFLRFLNHAQLQNTVGRTALDEWSACCTDLYLTTHNTHNRQTSIAPLGFKPTTISAGERPQTYALDRAATGTGINRQTRCSKFSNLFLEWKSTCFGQFLCPSSGVVHCTHSNGICHTGLLTVCEQDQDGTAFHLDPARKLSVKNSWWWTEELSKTCIVPFQE
jgi:hypothetical protein